MKTIVFGIVSLLAALIVPAYADCGGGGYEPFVQAMDEQAAETEQMFAFDFEDL